MTRTNRTDRTNKGHSNTMQLSQSKKNLDNSQQRQSILREWVEELPLREQGTMLTAVRGCDLTPKFPLDSVERQTVAFIRWCILNPADEREVDSEPGCFMRSTPPDNFKPSAFGHYPLHYVTHMMHTLQVIGVRYPEKETRNAASAMYCKICHSLHVNPETPQQMIARLSEDRIAKGTVVS